MFGRFSADDRATMMFAAQEAAELGHATLGVDHLILGMLGNARSPLFALLGEQGITLAASREAVRTYHAQRAEAADGDGQEAGSEDERLDDERRYDEDRDALRGLGIDLDGIRDAVRGRFGDDLSEGWGRRRDRKERRGEGRRDSEERGEHRGHGGRGHRDRGRECGPRGDQPGREERGEWRRSEGPRGPRGPWGPDAADEGCGPWSRGGRGPWGQGPGDNGPWESGRGRRGPRGRGFGPRFGRDVRDAVANAARFARDRDDRLQAEHLLIGILDLDSPAAIAAIEYAVEPAALRAAVLAALPEVDTPA